MRLPIRKADKYTYLKKDPVITREKFEELKNRLDVLIRVKRPQEAEEVKRLALMGDFSENAGYQLAKGRLRGINQRILEIEDLLKKAQIINPSNQKEIIEIGHQVKVLINEREEKIYQILGSEETNPDLGIISYTSPLGAALIGKKKDELVEVIINGKSKQYLIKEIF